MPDATPQDQERALRETLERFAAEHGGEPKPGWWVSQEAKCLYWYAEPVEHYGQWIGPDGMTSVLRAVDDDRIVGAVFDLDSPFAAAVAEQRERLLDDLVATINEATTRNAVDAAVSVWIKKQRDADA